MFFFSFGLGSVSAAVIGAATDAWGIGSAFWLNAAVGVLLMGIAYMIRRKLGPVYG